MNPTLRLVSANEMTDTAVAAKKILMVASGKGGVGKTWFSITLAQSLVMLNKRVLLFDGDLGLANVDIQLGLKPEKDLGTVLSGKSTLKDAITSYQKGFDILAGRSGCGSLAQLSNERLWGILQSLKVLASEYDYLILDVGAGIGDSVKCMARFADMCLVVVTDEPTSLTDAYALIKVVHTHYPHLPQQVVVNQAETLDKGQGVFETLSRVSQNFLKFHPSLTGIIRRDSRVKDAVRHQSLLLSRFPESEAGVDVKDIAASLIK